MLNINKRCPQIFILIIMYKCTLVAQILSITEFLVKTLYAVYCGGLFLLLKDTQTHRENIDQPTSS